MAQRRERYTGKKEGRREKIIDDMIGNNKKNRRKNEAEMSLKGGAVFTMTRTCRVG